MKNFQTMIVPSRRPRRSAPARFQQLLVLVLLLEGVAVLLLLLVAVLVSVLVLALLLVLEDHLTEAERAGARFSSFSCAGGASDSTKKHNS